MGNRYSNKTIFKNTNEIYEEIFENRDVPYIRQYGTPILMTPSARERAGLTRIRHVWSVGDKFYKLAIKYYNNAQYWWVIALYNQVPTEASVAIGDVVVIPLPLDRVLRTLKT
jgi:hypothetical protein